MAKTKLSEAERAKRRRKIVRTIEGGVFTVLALIGIVTIISLATAGIRNMIGQEDSKESFAKLVEPLVSLDPVPFDDVHKADTNRLMESAIWATFENEDITKYKKTADGHLIVPVTDISLYFTKLYGSEVSMNRRRNFTIDNLTYEYDSENDAYILPSTGWIGRYTAKVTDIKTAGGTKVLTVGYIKYDPNSGIGEANSEQSIVKYMEYVLIKEDASWHIYAVRYPAAED